MLVKPDILDQQIISCVNVEYGIKVTRVTFLPRGVDVNTAVYRVETDESRSYFLKLRKGLFDPICVSIPHFLSQLGIHTVIPPVENRKRQLFGKLIRGSTIYWMMLYPYIPGEDGYQVKMADHHWLELGSTFKKVHATKIPPDLMALLPCETYNPAWRESVKELQAQVEERTFADPVAKKLSTFMRAYRHEINRVVGRAVELASRLSQHSPANVLCHADAHPGNFLISDSGELYLVDWDAPILAPKEHDLMFFGAGMAGIQPGGREECLFYQGYGPTQVDQEALAYYRYERIIQDIAEFCKQLLLTCEGGEDREQAYTYLTSSFLPGNVVEAALRTDQHTDD